MTLFQRLGLQRNPFEHYTAETEPDIGKYAIRPPYLEAIQQRVKGLASFILFGDRGAGKSATRITVFTDGWKEVDATGSPFIVNLTDFTKLLPALRADRLTEMEFINVVAFQVIEQMMAWLASLEESDRAVFIEGLDASERTIIYALLQGFYLSVSELDRNLTTDQTLKDYAYDDMDGSAQTMKTLDTMESRQARIESMKAQQQVKADKAELDTLTGSVLQQLAKDPQSVVDQRTIDRAVALGDGAFAVHVHEWAKTLSSPVPEPEDQNSILAIQRLIMSGAPMSAITDEIGHDITNPSTLNTLYGLYNTVNSRDMGAVLQNATVKQVLTYLRQSFVSADVFTAGGDTPDGIQAETDFTLAMAAWYRKHPDADYTDIAAQATKVLKDMQSTLQSISPDRPYIRPNAISQDIGQQQQPIGVKPPALTAEAAQFDRLARGERVTGSAADPWSGSTPPSLKQLPQDQQDKINQRAATLGIDPQIMTDAVFKHLHSQPGGYRPPQRPAAVSRPNSGHGVASPAPADGLPDVGQGDVVQDDNGGVWDAQTGTNLIAPKVPTSLLQQLLGGYPSTFDMYYAEPTSEPSSSALDAINEAAPRGEPVIGGSRSWRNNNPGNMEFNAFTQAHGATGSDGRFAIFPDEATGKAAMEARLFADPLYAGKTIEQAIHTWVACLPGLGQLGLFLQILRQAAAAHVPWCSRRRRKLGGWLKEQLNGRIAARLGLGQIVGARLLPVLRQMELVAFAGDGKLCVGQPLGIVLEVGRPIAACNIDGRAIQPARAMLPGEATSILALGKLPQAFRQLTAEDIAGHRAACPKAQQSRSCLDRCQS